MRSSLIKWVDDSVIRAAAAAVNRLDHPAAAYAEAMALLSSNTLFPEITESIEPISIDHKGDFQFRSQARSSYPPNETVHGRFYGDVSQLATKPCVILLHGWNDQFGYRYRFPWMGRRMAKKGLHSVRLTLPYHFDRYVQGRDFICGDIVSTIEAVGQAVTDIRTLISMLKAAGVEKIGIWGASLGALLSGLVMTRDSRLNCGVLAVPVTDLEHAIDNLGFCQPIKRSLNGRRLPLTAFDLMHQTPQLSPENILVVAGKYDQFSPLEIIRDLARKWNVKNLWELEHGHITSLMMPRNSFRICRWLEDKLVKGR
jgi:dienelactone hydrolase